MEKSFHCRLYLLDVPQISCQARGQFVKSGISWLHSSIFFICKICHILDLGSSCVYTPIIRPIQLHPEKLCYVSAHIQCTKILWIACVANMCVCVSSPYLIFNRTTSRPALVFMSIYSCFLSQIANLFVRACFCIFVGTHHFEAASCSSHLLVNNISSSESKLWLYDDVHFSWLLPCW